MLRGPGDTLPLAKIKIEKKLRSLLKSRSVQFPAPLEDKLCKVIQKYKVTHSIEEVTRSSQGNPGKAQKIILIEGLSASVDRTVAAIHEEIINFQSQVEDHEEYPQEWEKQTKTTQVFTVQQASPEWNRVEQSFKKTSCYKEMTLCLYYSCISRLIEFAESIKF